MSWGRLDDGLHSHHKFVSLGPVSDPIALWTLCLSWSHDNYRQHPVPGYVPAHLPGRFAQSPTKGRRLAARLVEAELWEPLEGGGWTFHDWLDEASPDERAHFGVPEPSSAPPSEDGDGRVEQLETLRDKRRRAGRAGGAASWAARQPAQAGASTGAPMAPPSAGAPVEALSEQVLKQVLQHLGASAEASGRASAEAPDPVPDVVLAAAAAFASPNATREPAGASLSNAVQETDASLSNGIRETGASLSNGVRESDGGDRAEELDAAVREVLASASLPPSWGTDVRGALRRGCTPQRIVGDLRRPVTNAENPDAVRRSRLREVVPAAPGPAFAAARSAPDSPNVRDLCREHSRPAPCSACAESGSPPPSVAAPEAATAAVSGALCRKHGRPQLLPCRTCAELDGSKGDGS